MMPPLMPNLRVADDEGRLGPEFFRWLQQLALAASTEQSPVIGDMAPGGFTVEAGQFAIIVEELVLGGNEEAILGSDSVLVVL